MFNKNDTSGSHCKSPCLFTEIDDQIKWDFRMDVLSFFYIIGFSICWTEGPECKRQIKTCTDPRRDRGTGLPTKYRLLRRGVVIGPQLFDWHDPEGAMQYIPKFRKALTSSPKKTSPHSWKAAWNNSKRNGNVRETAFIFICDSFCQKILEAYTLFWWSILETLLTISKCKYMSTNSHCGISRLTVIGVRVWVSSISWHIVGR